MLFGPRGVFEKLRPGQIVVDMSTISPEATNQVICALNILAMSEGLHLAERIGLDTEKVLQVVSSGAAGSWMLSNLAPRILQNDFRPGFMIKLQQKDLRLATGLIEGLGEDFPGTALTYSLNFATKRELQRKKPLKLWISSMTPKNISYPIGGIDNF